MFSSAINQSSLEFLPRDLARSVLINGLKPLLHFWADGRGLIWEPPKSLGLCCDASLTALPILNGG
ncbi:unnamed protein product [Acanthoscelides obtectus]|uniref:Uncharacterized protein n=1 Tax=Acanthoscelides obtectus TaxID=200917 RepID=A0A9P0JSZ8_ACAOB|nr:unnamed protein product [Acanthoscelides obtectus]CAK1642828.1 hypothetical protein AOBTE_LOCUS13230 [Acanthoscelides obtectus]